MLEFIKAVSDTVFDMINAVHYDKPLVFTAATFQKKLVSHHEAVNINKLLNTFELIKAVSHTVFYILNAVHYDKPLTFTGAIALS